MKVSKNHITIQYRIGSALLLFFVLVTGDLFAIDYYQRQSGNWNNPTTWTTSTSWPHTANTGTYPQAGDNAHLANNGITATITLTADAQCANLMFDNSCTASVIAMGNYDLIVIGSWTTDWGCSGTITQGSGYLQINGGVGTISPTFNIAETVSNFRVGSTSFTKAGNAVLTVTSNYDYNCYIIFSTHRHECRQCGEVSCNPLQSFVINDFPDRFWKCLYKHYIELQFVYTIRIIAYYSTCNCCCINRLHLFNCSRRHVYNYIISFAKWRSLFTNHLCAVYSQRCRFVQWQYCCGRRRGFCYPGSCCRQWCWIRISYCNNTHFC